MHHVAARLFHQYLSRMQAHALEAALRRGVIVDHCLLQEGQFLKRRRGGKVVHHACRQLQPLLVILAGVVVIVLLLEEALLVIQQHLVVPLQKDEVGVPLGDDRHRAVKDPCCPTFRLTFNIQLVAGVLDTDVNDVGMVGQPTLGVVDLLLGHRQHLQAALRVAMHDSHGHRYRQPYHAGAGDADTHGVLEDILAQSKLDSGGLTTQRLDSLGHTQCHGPRLGTSRRQQHLVPQNITYLLTEFLIHRQIQYIDTCRIKCKYTTFISRGKIKYPKALIYCMPRFSLRLIQRA